MPPQIKKEQLKKPKQIQTNSPHAPPKKPKQNQTEKKKISALHPFVYLGLCALWLTRIKKI